MNRKYVDWKPLRLYTEDEERVRVGRPLDKDPDVGPERLWRWAHHEVSALWFIMSQRNHELRAQAYLMWDNNRIEKLGLFSNMYSIPPEEHYYERSRIEFELMERSCLERKRIWMRGGRGWWTEGDESRIVWLPQEEQSP